MYVRGLAEQRRQVHVSQKLLAAGWPVNPHSRPSWAQCISQKLSMKNRAGEGGFTLHLGFNVLPMYKLILFTSFCPRLRPRGIYQWFPPPFTPGMT